MKFHVFIAQNGNFLSENLSVKASDIFSNISSDTEWKDVRGEGQISLHRAKTKSLFRLFVAI